MTPRDFDPGYYQQVDMNLNADFTYSSSETLNWAFGAEYRTEEFTVGAGQESHSLMVVTVIKASAHPQMVSQDSLLRQLAYLIALTMPCTLNLSWMRLMTC
jgi:hypothetical protein